MRAASDQEFELLKESMKQDVSGAVEDFMKNQKAQLSEFKNTVGWAFYPLKWYRGHNDKGEMGLLTEAELVRFYPTKEGRVVRQVVASFKVHRPLPQSPIHLIR